MIVLRSATTADLGALTALEDDLFGQIAWSTSAMAEELAAIGDSRVVLLAEEDDEICGYAILLVTADVADLQRVAVGRARQRGGVGSALLAAIVDHALSAGVPVMMLEVAADNAPALAFYAERRFVEIARRPRYYSDGRDAVVMRADLRALGAE